MSTTVTLPPTLHNRIASLGRRVRLLRTIRGVSLLVLVAALTAGAALLADLWLELPALARRLGFSAWLSLTLGTLLFGLVLPLFRRLEPVALAATIEETYPELGERLTSTVELTSEPACAHGSPALIGLLLEETEARSGRLDFCPAVSSRPARSLGAAAGLVLLLAAVPVLPWPQQYQRLASRFFLPWIVPVAGAPYALEITPGNTHAAQGRPLTISLHVLPHQEKAQLPTTSTLVVVDAAGLPTRREMTAVDSDNFTAEYTVPGDFAYRIEAGSAVSPTYQVTAVLPVELAAESPTITVTPPAYARATREAESFHGLVDLSPLSHSQIRLEFRFNRPAVAARLEWVPDEPGAAGKNSNPGVRQPLVLTEDRRGASCTMTADAVCTYRVVLEAEHGVLTERVGGALTPTPDQPPLFGQFAGKEDLQAVLAYERIPLDIDLTDDVGVAGAALEYQVNDEEPVREPIELQGVNRLRATGRHLFQLAGKVKEGDMVRYRIWATDNLPMEFGGPHVVYYPADRWLMLKIVRQGAPLKEQEIREQHDEIRRRLEAIKASVAQEKRAVYKVQQESRYQPDLTPDQARQVERLEEQNRASEKALRELVRDTSVSPVLQPLADRAHDVADHEMKRSEVALEKAGEKNAKAPERTAQFEKADRQLASALRRLDDLKRANDRLAQDRMAQAKMEALADRQKQLSERAAELAAKDAVGDPSAEQQAEQLKREQGEVAAELQRLAEQSEALRQGMDEARAQQARDLAEKARDLAQAQRDLARAAEGTDRKRKAEQLAEMARKQQELAEQADRLARQTQQPAQAAKTNPLKAEDLQQAAEALKQGEPEEAIKHQDQAARDLDRLANDFDRAIHLARDPREAARQLARLQEGLRKRAEEETRKSAGKPPAEQLRALKREQEAVREAAEQVSVPPQNQGARQEKQRAVEEATRAAQGLEKQDARQAAARMEQARQALERLADQMPNGEQRRQQALRELARLLGQQNEVARQAEQAKPNDPGADRRLAEAARRQAEVAKALGKMDTPNQEARQGRVQEALNRALADLMDRRHEDVPASQQQARRELERLQQALNGHKPADEKARELVRRQQELAHEGARVAADPKAPPEKVQELQQRQQKLAQETRSLPAPEAPQRRKEAAEAVMKAEQAVRIQPTNPETHQRMQEAARKLDDLARQLRSQEEDAARAERLAKQQAEAATEAEQEARRLPGKLPGIQSVMRQQEIAEEAKQVRGGDEARAEKRKALEALSRTHQGTASERARAQRQAADALRDLADKLAGRKDDAQPAGHKDGESSPPQALPTKEQSEQARKLAQEQRELRNAVQNAADQARAEAASARPNPVGELAREQTDIARKAGDLARQVGEEQGAKASSTRQADQAHQAAQQAANQVQAGALQNARHSGQQAAEQMRQLARRLADTPRGKTGPQAPDVLQEARQLTRRQEELNRKLEPLAGDADAQRGQQQSRQQDLQQQADDLRQQFKRLGHELGRTPAAQAATQQAANSTQQARIAMQHANAQSRLGNQPLTRRARQQAAEALDRAAQQAAQAPGPQMVNQQGSPKQGGEQKPGQKAGESVKQAQGQITQAQGQLNQGRNQGALAAMQQAAQSLKQAAEQLAQAQQQGQPGQPGQPNARGATGSGLPDPTVFGLDRSKYAGKSWGELPGELRTRIVQDMKAKYGDDYARMIKLYFEQLADTKK